MMSPEWISYEGHWGINQAFPKYRNTAISNKKKLELFAKLNDHTHVIEFLKKVNHLCLPRHIFREIIIIASQRDLRML